jgi:hypothetical protein
MSDLIVLVARYLATWNETDPTYRRALLAETWTGDGTYVDPLMCGQGHEQIDGLIAAVQQRFPNFRFTLEGRADGHADYLRFSWALGPEGADAVIRGTDFAKVEQGRLRTVIGFLDQMPAA